LQGPLGVTMPGFFAEERIKVSRQSEVQIKADELRKYRRSKRESQGLFWSRFGVTQSRGSRFEKGAEIPRPVAILLELYLNGVLTDGDLGTARNSESSKRPMNNILGRAAASAQTA
jgi:hypothetical protein